ncbi:MAG: tetratricopeptide repeat protein [Gemmatimonadetes bacterium]|nr:tetratricopeptide repeat protein [Gemmatimonadota bacterium]
MIRFQALGGIELGTSDGVEAKPVLRHPKRLLLLAYLLLARPQGFHRRDTLVALFWPDLDHAHARAALRQALHYLRRALGSGVLVTRGDEEVGVDAGAVACDALELRGHLAAGRLEAAVELYRGELLPGLHVSGCPELERWLDDERAELRRRALVAAASLAQREQTTGGPAGAIRWARFAASLAPHDETTALQLVSLLDAAGRTGEAVEAYEAYAMRMAEDLELSPGDEIEALVRTIRTRPRPPVSVAGPPPVEPVTSPSPPRERGRVGSRRVAGAVALVVLASAAVLLSATRGRPAPDATAGQRVVVLPFPVAGDPARGYLREGLADLLSSRLDGAGDLRAVDVHAVLGALSPADTGRIGPERGREVAGTLHAGWFVLGTVMESGDRLLARAELYDATGAARGAAESLASTEGELFDLVDDLARQLLAALPPTDAGRLTRLGLQGTDSFPALKAYLQGEGLLRRGRYDAAVAAYERAVAADTGFALAYYRLAVARQQDPTPEGREDAHTRALAHADRLRPRDRLLLRAFAAFQEHRASEAETLYREVLSVHPDEVEAWFFLGQVLTYYQLWRGRPVPEARVAFERALALDPAHLGALNSLSWIAAIEERFDEGAALVARMLELQPDGPFAPLARVRLAFWRGDAAARDRAMAELPLMDSYAVNWAQRAAHFSGDPDGRAVVATLLTEPHRTPSFQRLGQTSGAYAALDRGRWKDARAGLERLRESDPHLYPVAVLRYSLRPLVPATHAEIARAEARLLEASPPDPRLQLHRIYLLGLARSRLGDPAGAEDRARELDARAAAAAGRQAGLAAELARGLRGWIAFEAGRPGDALAILDRLDPERWWIRAQGYGLGMDPTQTWLMAEVLTTLGRDREALDWYAPLGWLWGDVGLLAPKHLRMAEAYERLGERDRAAYHYGRFATLWSGCDPELEPLVTRATRRSARP